MPIDLFKSLRPRQWVKNLFVLAPLFFAKKAGETGPMTAAATAFALYCLASSSVYLFNDVMDREQDAVHPEKRHRPIASGRISTRLALFVSACLALVAAGGGFLLGLKAGAALTAYLGINLLYTMKIKHIPYLDVFSISMGFLLRVIGGAVAIPVVISNWILLCTLFISIFLGLGKRVHELLLIGPSQDSRRVLRRYSLRSTNLLLALSGLAAWLSFACYSLSDRVFENFGTHDLIWTTPLVALGQLRFVGLVRRTDRARSPTDALVTDPPFMLVALAWLAVTLFLVYLR